MPEALMCFDVNMVKYDMKYDIKHLSTAYTDWFKSSFFSIIELVMMYHFMFG